MMSKYLKTTCVLAMAAAIFASLVFAQDPVKVAPTAYKPLLDNERVRVLYVTVKPGETIPFHSHPDYSLYIIEGGLVRFSSAPADTGVAVELIAGNAFWHNAEVHSAKNVGTTTVRVLATELKEPKPEMIKKEGK
jgi:quercetin dioxygenase-like cupin family protein